MKRKQRGRGKRDLGLLLVAWVVMAFGFTWAWAGQAADDKTVADFYKGAVLRMMVDTAPGGGQDTRVRTIAPYVEEYSGARLIVENRPGAGGYIAVNYLYHNAKPDGLTVSTIFTSGVFLAEELGRKEATWKLDRLNYIARITKNWGGPLMVGKRSTIRSLDDLLKSKKEIKFAVPSPTMPGAIQASLLAEALDLKIKIVPGYPGGKECVLAVMRGEVDMTSMPAAGFKDAFDKGDLIALAMYGDKVPWFLPKDTPMIENLNLNEKKQKYLDLIHAMSDLGNVVAAPRGIPPEKVKFLDKVFIKALQNPKVIKLMDVRGDYRAPLSGVEYLQLLKKSKTLLAEIGIKELDYVLFEKYY